MKFGQQLECSELPEWRGQYLPYRQLKKRLQDIASGRGTSAAITDLFRNSLRSPTSAAGAPRSPLLALPPDGAAGAGSVGVSPPSQLSAFGSPQPATPGSVSTGQARIDDPAMMWVRAVEAEAVRIGARVKLGLEELRAQLAELAHLAAAGLGGGGGGGSAPAGGNGGGGGGGDATGAVAVRSTQPTARQSKLDYLELRVLDALGQLAEGAVRLRGFAELNHAALYKILKKHDKVLNVTDGLTVYYPRLVEITGLGNIERFDRLDAEIKEAFMRHSGSQGLEVSPEVVRIAAGLGSTGGLRGRQGHVGEQKLYFFLGFSMALLLSIVVLIALPEQDPETFSTAYFLASLSVFRVVLSVVLVLWGMGAVARTCEDNCINHMFILGVDPRCRICPNFFFAHAAVLTSLWITIFAMYVVDYKWMVLPRVLSNTGFNSRSSWHYVLYPSVLLGLMVLMAVLPSRECRCRYKSQVLRGVGRTCAAPLFAVNFGDNLIGDVLTSLAKPLQDVPAAWCYFFSHHPQVTASVERFAEFGTTCAPWEHHWIRPVISGAPFLFRLMQCARRFYDTKETKHLCNFGKYFASLLVVVVTSFWGKAMWAVVAVSTMATVYAAVWDVRMDWGLGMQELALLIGFGGSGSTASTGGSGSSQVPEQLCGGGLPASGGAPVTAAPASVADAAAGNTLTDARGSGHSASFMARGQSRRHFSPRFYWCAASFDVAARLTWVLTLMPINLISDDIVQRAVLETFVTIVEIARRSLWSVLRIEYEQVSNASGYRALLWVPLRMKANGEETELQRPAREPLLIATP